MAISETMACTALRGFARLCAAPPFHAYQLPSPQEGKTAQAALVLQRAYGLLHDPELPLLRLAPRARELLPAS